MPIGAMVAAGSLVLAGATPAQADQEAAPDTASSLNEEAVPGEVAATESDTEKVKVTQTRTDSATATKKLTKKVMAKATSSARATKSATREVTVTVTRYAPTDDEASAEAEQVAHDAAVEQATAAATKAARSAAGKAAHAKARTRARKKADHNAHNEFSALVLHRAAALKGRPYRYGGDGPNSFDCSGYIRYVLKKAGVNNLPRTSAGIGGKVDHVSKKHRKRGDLILFGSGSGVYHVAIYAGHGKIWHAPGSGRSVTKVKIWTSGYSVGRAI